MTRVPSSDEIAGLAAREAFGRPLIVNVHRALVVEAIISVALADWSWVSTDYASYDFQHLDGTRLEVKQTAARQSWASPKPSTPQWDIAERTGFWEGASWIERKGRNADVFVLAHHPISDDTADHRDPGQWVFYVVGAKHLPSTRTIRLPGVMRLAPPTSFADLAAAVARVNANRKE